MKTSITHIATLCGSIVLLAPTAWGQNHHNSHLRNSAQEANSTQQSTSSRIPAYYAKPPEPKDLPSTLPPERFSGRIQEAYEVARKIPVTLSQVPCFCYCDEGLEHKSLHSCYETEHSAHCSTCIDEAVLAGELKKEGLSDVEVRERIIAKFQSKQ